MSQHVVAGIDEIPPGEHIVVELEGRDIGIFNIYGEFHAYTSWCAHQGGPVCEGWLDGTTAADFDSEKLSVDVEWVKEGEILICPWHGWEYDVTTGECRSKPDVRLPEHSVHIEDGNIIVTL